MSKHKLIKDKSVLKRELVRHSGIWGEIFTDFLENKDDELDEFCKNKFTKKMHLTGPRLTAMFKIEFKIYDTK